LITVRRDDDDHFCRSLSRNQLRRNLRSPSVCYNLLNLRYGRRTALHLLQAAVQQPGAVAVLPCSVPELCGTRAAAAGADRAAREQR